MIQLLYFGWVRAKIGVGGEDIEPPAGIADVRGLIGWLRERGGGYAEALDDLRDYVASGTRGPDGLAIDELIGRITRHLEG